MRKKFLSLLIAAVMVLAMVPATAWADGASLTLKNILITPTNTTVAVLTSVGFQNYLKELNDNGEADLMKFVDEYSDETFISGGEYEGVTDGFETGMDSAFVLFFAKPVEGYALTTFGTGNVFSIDKLPTTDNDTNFAISYNYRNIIYNALHDNGYVAVFGFSRKAGAGGIWNSLQFEAYSEELVTVDKTVTSITVSSDNTIIESDIASYKVDEGDKITYEITVTRRNISEHDSTRNISYNSFTLEDPMGIKKEDINNSTDWEISSDGSKQSYTTEYTYEVTDGNVTEGEIINTATVDYEYSVDLASNSGSTITGKLSAEGKCSVKTLGTYTVTFDSNGGSSVDSQTVKEGDTVTEPKDPTRKGYTFVGWYDEYGDEYDFDEPVLETGFTLYAKWTKNKSSGGSSYSLDETTDSSSSDDDDEEEEEDYDSDIKLNTEEHFQYISGYPDGTVRPTANITRAEVATIFYRLLDDDTRNAYYSTYTTFDDVDSDQWYLKAVATLTNAGILHGDSGSNTFRPDDNITRAEFATIVSFFDELVYTDEDAFSDISGHWANVYINSAYAKGWVAGYNGKYNPDTAITRAEAMTLINNVLGREVDEDGLHEDAKQWPDNLEYAWYYYEVLEATNYHEYVIDDGDEVWTDILPNKTWNEGSASA